MTNTNFQEKIKSIVRAIPRGTTRTYKEVAVLAGFPNAARAVGSVMRQNYDPTVPCHRVIRSDGVIGNYNRGGAEVKRKLLISEGALTL